MPWWKRNTNESEVAGQIKQEVINALQHLDLRGNSANPARFRQQVAQAISGGYDGADTLHNVYLDYGYPQTLDFNNFWNMYRRFGIARNIVELPVDTGWMKNPVVEGSKEFNAELEKLIEQVKLWDRLSSLDKRQRVGRYAGMFMRVRDNKQPTEPIDQGALNGIASIIQLIPIYEGQLTISTTESDPMSDNFGMPSMYHFNSGSTGNRNDKLAASFNIHPDRIIIAAEGADNGGVFGISSLEAPYNSLMDLRKIIGAGGEGFYKNAAQNIVHELQDASSAKQNEALLNKLNEATDDFMANRSRRSMWTPGMKTNVLDSSLIQPREFFDIALADTSAASKIPSTILIGMQTGRLASTEDSRHFLSGVNSRNQNFVADMIRSHIDWFIKFRVLPASEYAVEWADLLALSKQDKLTNSQSMADINEKQFKSGGDVPFSGEEIREEAGFDPEEMEEPEGEDDDDTGDDEGNE